VLKKKQIMLQNKQQPKLLRRRNVLRKKQIMLQNKQQPKLLRKRDVLKKKLSSKPKGMKWNVLRWSKRKTRKLKEPDKRKRSVSRLKN